MEKRYEDLTGLKFGMLTVIKEYDQRIQRKRAWICKCDCGNTHIAIGTRLSPKRGDSHG